MSTTRDNRSVRGILDDDDALDIVDALEEDDDDDLDDDDFDSLFDDDPFEEPKAPARETINHPVRPNHVFANQPSAQAEQRTSKSEPTPAPSSDHGGSRIQFYRSLQGFLQAMSEAAPIYLGEKSRSPDVPEADIRQNVGTLCGKHLSLVEKCLEINNANTQDIMLRYQRRSLAKNLAELYEHYSIDELDGLIDVARNWAAQSKDFENSGSDSGTGDGWLSVKLSLFTATLKYYQSLDGMWCGHQPSEVMLELQRIAILLAKEVAFSWSKRSQVSDRESLFSSALPHCLKIAEMAYKEIALSLMNGENYNSLSDQPTLAYFEDTADEMYMGYVDEGMVELKQRVSRMAAQYIRHAKTPALRQDELIIWRNAMLEDIDKAMASAWEEASSDLLEEIEEMSEEDRNIYVEKHDVMDFSRFEVRVIERLSTLDRPGRMIQIDFTEVTNKAKKHLAWMWGVSDSLIAARKENLPGD